MKSPVLSLTVLFATLAACSAPPSPSKTPEPTGPPARVDVGQVLVRHPFAAVLAQYDVDIATLQDAAGTAPFDDLHRELEFGATSIDRELIRASASERNLRTRKAEPPLPGGPEREANFGSGTLATFRQALEAREARAHDLRASQLREHEANVALDFERAHAGRRLVLRVKLRNLHLDASTRSEYQAQLSALDAREEALLLAVRRHDEAILTAYDAELRTRATANFAAMSSEVAHHARAVQAIPRPDTGALSASAMKIADDREAAIAAFNTARHDLTGRFAELRSMDDRARKDARNELAALERERDALRDQMIASVEARARRIASEQHLGKLYVADAPNNARDVTRAVLRSLPH